VARINRLFFNSLLNAFKPVAKFPSRKRNALLPWTTALRALCEYI